MDCSHAHRASRDRNFPHDFERRISLRSRNENREAPLVRHVEWIEPENFAGALHRFLDRDFNVSSSLMQTFRSSGNFVQRSGQTAARQDRADNEFQFPRSAALPPKATHTLYR